MTTDNEIGLHSVPIEVLANNVFKFFEFCDWLKYLVPVCKQWRQAAVQSQQEKLVRLNLSKSKTIFSAQYLVNYYRITALILEDHGYSIYHLASIINASPKLKTVAFVSPDNTLGTLKFGTNALPLLQDRQYDPKIYMNHVTTVKVPYSCCSLLCLFPNAEKITLCDDPRYMQFVSTRVAEVEISTYYYHRHAWSEFITKMKNENFPHMKKLYMVIDEPAENFDDVQRVANELGFELICRILIAEDREMISRNGPVFHRDTSFPSSLERVTCWNYCDEKFFRKCHSLQTSPFWMSVRFQLEENYTEQAKEAAIETLKQAHPVKMDSFDNLSFISDCAFALAVLSPHRILRKVGRDKLRIMLNGRWKCSTVLHSFIQQCTHKLLAPILDLTDFKDIIETQTLKKLHKEIVYCWYYNISGIRNIAAIIQHIDAILTERHVKGYGFGTLPVDIIFKIFSQRSYSDISAIAQLFNIDLNQSYNSDGDTLLSLAIKNISSDLSNILHSLKFGIDVNKPDKNGITPLIKAIQHSNKRAVELLLQNGADPNIAGDAVYPLHLALAYTDHLSFKIVDTLLYFGADINKPFMDKKGRMIYPICVAADRNTPANVQKVRRLILQGADLSVMDQVGNTLLHMIQNPEMIPLFGQCIDVHTANKLGRTPLHSAAMTGSPCLQSIISLGADVNRCDMFGWTPLMMAMKFSCTKDTLNPLLATKKVNIEARDKNGQSFTIHVMKHSSWNQIHNLLNCEEFVHLCQYYLTEDNVRFVVDECKTLLYEWKDLSKAFKIITCHITLTKFFIEQVGLDVNHSDVLGNTLISCMKVNDDSKKVIEYLVAKGAKLNFDQDPLLRELFKSPTFQWQSYQKMKLLMKYGGMPIDPNKNGVSLMDVDPESKQEQDLHPDYFNCYQPYDLSNILSFVRK